MDRRKSLKLIATGAIATPIAIASCKTDDKKATDSSGENKFNLDRNPDEIKYENKVLAQDKFFTTDEMATITILADIIIPKDEVSGSASDAGVPAFIEFIVKDMPQHQEPMRGGLRWLDVYCLKNFKKPFKSCTQQEQLSVVDKIAYPKKAAPELSQGVNFFNVMRNLTATGFYTSEIGVKDVGYAGNAPNKWNGVPADVLKQYNKSYSEKDLKLCVSYDNPS
jgi:gluconate 2-dehydrogenase gamma chain